jgi:hypothetical protein
MTLRDPEVLDLLADDPTLLALADAVVATQQAPRRPLLRRRAPRVAVVAAAAAAAIIVALVLPQGKHGIVDRAIAAIGDGRVMHIVSEMPIGAVDVDLQSGRRTVQQARLEYWADQQLKRAHVVMTFNGQVVLDLLWPQDAQRGATMGTIDPAFAALWTGYRQALEDGTATRVGEGDAFGHHVYWLRFSPTEARSPGTEVAVDAQTYKPVVFRAHNGALDIDQHILLAESTDFSAADFTRDGPNPFFEGVDSGSGVASMGSEVGSEESAPNTTVPSGWLTAGPEADGHQLAAVVPQTITTSDKKTVHGIRLVYGDLEHGLEARGATTIDELSAPDESQPWARIPPGAVRIQAGQTGDSNGEHPEWSGNLVKNGRYVTITTQHGEQALIAIARSLRPVP